MSEKRFLHPAELKSIFEGRYTQDNADQPLRLFNYRITYDADVARETRLSGRYFLRKLIFDQCDFEGRVTVKSREYSGPVHFVNCTFNATVEIDIENVTLDSNTFNSHCVIKSQTTKNLEINDIDVKNILSISCDCPKLTMKGINQKIDTTFSKVNVAIKGSELFAIDVKTSQCDVDMAGPSGRSVTIVNPLMTIANLKSRGANLSIDISGGRINGLALVDFSENLSSIVLKEKLSVGQMQLQLENFSNIDIDDCNIESLRLLGLNSSSGIVSITKTTFHALLFDKVVNEGHILLGEIRVKQSGLVSFRSTNLGKADFINCDYSRAVLEFENSKVTEAFLSHTEFPKTVKIGDKYSHTQAQLAFGQLNTAFQKQGDNIRALEYSSREIEAHYNAITWRRFSEKLNLFLNKWSNNFGRSWSRGIAFSFVSGLTFFTAFLLSTPQFNVGIPYVNWSLLPAFLKFMNPLRFIDAEAMFSNTPVSTNIQLNSWSYFWDFTGRIIIAYGYYQTIQAFRRFGKK